MKFALHLREPSNKKFIILPIVKKFDTGRYVEVKIASLALVLFLFSVLKLSYPRKIREMRVWRNGKIMKIVFETDIGIKRSRIQFSTNLC